MHDDAKETDVPPGMPNLSGDGVAELPPPSAEPSEPATDGPTAPGTEPPKRRRGRKRGSKNATTAAPDVAPGPSAEEKRHLAVALGAGFGIGCDMVAAARGNHWKLSEGDKQVLGEAWAEALAPYMGTAGKWMPFIIATVHTVGVFIPKVQADRLAHTPNADAREIALVGGRPVEVVPMADVVAAVESQAPDVAPPVNTGSLDIEPPPNSPVARARNGNRRTAAQP